jgi:hypothetical protein
MSKSPNRLFGLRIAVFSLCVVAGAAVLSISTRAGGEEAFRESSKHVYFFCLLVIGLVAGCISPRSWWNAWMGVFLGQAMVFAMTPTPRPNPFSLLGFVVLFGFSLVSFAGGVLGALLRVAIRHVTSSP